VLRFNSPSGVLVDRVAPLLAPKRVVGRDEKRTAINDETLVWELVEVAEDVKSKYHMTHMRGWHRAPLTRPILDDILQALTCSFCKDFAVS
jgi:hypothetical protein